MQKYHRYITGDAKADRNFQDIQRSTDSIINAPLLNGKIISCALTTSYKPFNHGLGKSIINAIALAGTGTGVVLHDASQDTDASIYLKATVSGTYSVLVF